MAARLVRAAVRVMKCPAGIRTEDGAHVVLRIGHSIARSPVSALKIAHLGGRLVHELVRDAAGRKAGAITRAQQGFANICDQSGRALKDVDELVLQRMCMP